MTEKERLRELLTELQEQLEDFEGRMFGDMASELEDIISAAQEIDLRLQALENEED